MEPLSFSTAEVLRFRDETKGCEFVNHLNNAGAALMPDTVTQAVQSHIDLEWKIGGYEAADLRKDAIDGFYREAGLLINAKPSNIAFTASATDSFTRALSSIPFVQGDVILTDRDDFISNQIQFLSLQKRLGIKLVRIENAPVGGLDVNDLEQKLFALKPKLLSITHIPTNSGLVQPVDEVAAVYSRYRNRFPDQTWYILDACQSIGQRPVDVNTLACDFLSVTNRKFLRGPRGTGFLFISDRALEARLEPMFLDMRGADWTGPDEYRQERTATRFEDWEFPYALVIGSAEAIRYCRMADIGRIKTQIDMLSGHLRAELSKNPKVRILDRGPQLASSVTFTTANNVPEELVAAFRKRKINVVASYRNFAIFDFNDKNVDWAIRVSPHYYNTIEEINTFCNAAGELI